MGSRNAWLFAGIAGLVLGAVPGAGAQQPAPAPVGSVPNPQSVQNVVMTGPGNRFSPPVLVIQVGQTVTWRNTSQGFHNFNLDDGSFRCANGCDQDRGGKGDPASNAWSFTLQFNAAGVVPYFCEVHGGPGGDGMSGMIVVQNRMQTKNGAEFSPITDDRMSAAAELPVSASRGPLQR